LPKSADSIIDTSGELLDEVVENACSSSFGEPQYREFDLLTTPAH
jgi:hypothetical protein